MPLTVPALIIIDMQECMAVPASGARNNPAAETNIAAVLGAWRAAGGHVVHVRHMSRSPQSGFWPGQRGAEFQEQFTPLPHEAVFEKNVPDAFVNSGLERALRMRGIERLVVAGVSTNISVESTVRSAGNLGFSVEVLADGTFTFDKVDYAGTRRSADEVHAMSLANMDGEFATVTTCGAILDRFA